MSRQLTFDLPPQVALGGAAFFVSAANATAHAMITAAVPWPEGKLVLVGPPGSGKSHLLRVWQEGGEAHLLSAPQIDPDADLPPPGSAVAIDDIDWLPRAAEEYVFHLHNHLRATGGRLLAAAASPPARWSIALPDLASRMQAATVVRIDDPDDALLGAVLAKHFDDRQLVPAPDVIPYLVPRIERSFAAAAEIVARIDALALSERREITRKFAGAVLDKVAGQAR